MRVRQLPNGRSLVDIEDYGDLLSLRTVAEYHFVDEATADCDTGLLAAAGLVVDVVKEQLVVPRSPFLFDYQTWIVERAWELERFAIFADTGLGKTVCQLEWARLVQATYGGRVLIVAPLNVVGQTISEAEHFYGAGLSVADLTDKATLFEWLATGDGVGITNYEKLDGTEHALPVAGVVLDESSMLKSSMGSRRTAIVNAFRGVRFKLCCSATPAPNDRIEYAEHAYFLDVVRSTREFLAAFFVNRDGNWQLKAHGVDAFYRHLASWSVFVRDPKAWGFDDHLADLPQLEESFPHVDLTPEQMERAREWETGNQPSMFGATPGGVTSRTKMMQIAHGFQLGDTLERFPAHKPLWIADLVNGTSEQVIVWVTFDEEGDVLARLIPGAVHLSGKTSMARRGEAVEAFRAGNGPRVLILKPSMFGHGLNLQACSVQVFSTITDSFERYYQCVRRSYRYGQTKPVRVYVPLTALDEAICANTMAKQSTFLADAERQELAFVDVLRPRDSTERTVRVSLPQTEISRVEGERFTLVQADCIAHMPTMAEASMDLAVFSPPFANLFTYSSQLADMGNVREDAEYRLQWAFFAEQLLRVMKPGRVVAIHCADIIRFAGQHGTRHTYDYPSDVRAGMQEAGFLYNARIAIDKNPQVQATRTKDQNLLFVTLKRDALNSHPQASECVLVFHAPGEAETPVKALDISNQEWIRWAHHVWYDIRETDVLNAALGKEHEDERHICPLQLGLIERCVRLWTNAGETVFSPFAGIGSEGWEAIAHDRHFYGVELKESYFRTAARNLAEQESMVINNLRLDFNAPIDVEPAAL